MSGRTLDETASLTCPHGGKVQIIVLHTAARASAARVVTASDTFLVVGCSFSAGTKPSPCVQVEWLSTDTNVRIRGARTISTTSTGVCKNTEGLAQGPVWFLATQPHVGTR